jgi:hypothetical protein
MEALRLFSTFSASLRWNYPNRFVGSPYPALAGQGLSARTSSPSHLYNVFILKNLEYVKSIYFA